MKVILKNLLLVVALISLAQISVLGQDTGSNNASYLEALKHYNLQQNSDAKRLFTEIISADPSNDAAYYYLAQTYLRMREPEIAEKMMLSAVSLDPSNLWYQSNLADIYTILNKTDQALEIYNTLKKDDPLNVDLSEKLIDLYVRTGDFQKAAEALEAIEEHIGRSEFTGLFRYNLFIYQNKHDEAITFLEELNEEFGTARIATILGDYNATMNRDSLALNYYNQALSLEPGYIPAIFGQAEVYRMMRHYDPYFDKINIFLANNEVDPSMKSDYIKQILSNQQFVQTFLPQVDTMMRTVYAVNYQDSTIAYDYGIFMAQMEDIGEALSAFKGNADRYPRSKNILINYLSYLHYIGDFFTLSEESELYLKNNFPNDSDLLQLKAIAQFNLGETKSAIITFKEILKHTTDQAVTASTLTTIGDLTYETGDKKGAYKYYKRALKVDPKYIVALNNYAYYLALEGKKLKQAKEMSKITIEEEPDNPTYLDTYAWILHVMGDNEEARNIFRHAMLYGGKEDADILDHYADVLYALKEYDLAFIYWEQADEMDSSLGIADKIEKRKAERKK